MCVRVEHTDGDVAGVCVYVCACGTLGDRICIMYCTNKNLHDGYMHLVYGYLKLSNLIGLYGVSTCIVHSYRDDLCYMYCVALPCLFV